MAGGQERPLFQLVVRDLLALTVSAAFGIVVFLKQYRSYQPPWEPYIARDAVVATFVFIVSLGVLTAALGRKSRAIVGMAIALQVLSAMSMAVPEFGFDHRSAWGLDFAHLMLLWLIYCAALIGGVTIAFATKQRRAVSLQLWLLPVLGAVILIAKMIRAAI